MLRVMTDSSDQVSFHVSQFLGTGIVRAYKTETSGLPGLRILLHPDLEPLLNRDASRIVSVTPADKMRLNVKLEVNYLEEEDNHLGQDFQDSVQFDCLRMMTGQTDEHLQYHYIETFKAWNKMRAQLGRLPYPWPKFLDRDEYDYAHGIRERPRRHE